jgi:hypothetical protein
MLIDMMCWGFAAGVEDAAPALGEPSRAVQARPIADKRRANLIC